MFEDAEALFLPDPDNHAHRDRAVTLGLSVALRVLIVIHCERRDGDVIRLISARKADLQERQMYAARSA